MNLKTNVLGALILVMSFIIIGISFSYAYYTSALGEMNPENKATTISSGGLKMDFATTQYINTDVGSLINDDDVLKSINDKYYTSFSISFPDTYTKDGKTYNNASSGSYEIYLTNLKMTENFISSDVKWALCPSNATALANCTQGTFATTTKNSNGNYTTAEIVDSLSDNAKTTVNVYDMNNITLLENASISRENSPVNYKLYVWLSNNPNANQRNLLNGKLSAKVGFRGVVAK